MQLLGGTGWTGSVVLGGTISTTSSGGRRHAHDLVSHPIGFLFKGIVRLADAEFGLDRA